MVKSPDSIRRVREESRDTNSSAISALTQNRLKPRRSVAAAIVGLDTAEWTTQPAQLPLTEANRARHLTLKPLLAGHHRAQTLHRLPNLPLPTPQHMFHSLAKLWHAGSPQLLPRTEQCMDKAPGKGGCETMSAKWKGPTYLSSIAQCNSQMKTQLPIITKL